RRPPTCHEERKNRCATCRLGGTYRAADARGASEMSTGRPVSRVLSRARGAGTVISLAGRLPGRSSDLPEGRNGPDQPCPLIWPCSRWGLPSQPVTRLLVGSYPAFSPLPGGSAGRYPFCCTFPALRFIPPPGRPEEGETSDGGRYPPPRPVEPGLSSPRSAAAGAEAPPAAFRATTVRPACGLVHYSRRGRAPGFAD